MGRLFGTDGVRGLANRDLTPELALELGRAAATYLRRQAEQMQAASGSPISSASKLRAVVGRDTRISGDFIDYAISAGLASAGLDVVRVGVVPTPAVAFITAENDFDLGVMISASHNPMPDNGIKFFARGGFKLPDAVENEIEELLELRLPLPTGADVGVVTEDRTLALAYARHLSASVESLDGLKIAVDCANGAAYELGPLALRQAGAELVVIHAEPNGCNINDSCGSTHPEDLQRAVVEHGCDFGVAFDGDADRCLAVDSQGQLVDGDKIMGMLAVQLHSEGKLDRDTLVVTVMSNLGLLIAMQKAGIKTVQTAVGDRYVLEEMRREGYSLGGEQSGHVINAHYATTGDGVLTALCVADAVKKNGSDLRELTDFVERLPQTLVNVSNVDKSRTDDPVLLKEIDAVEEQLGDTGRVLLRPSGTEPLVRVMVEADSQERADRFAQHLGQVVKDRLSL